MSDNTSAEAAQAAADAEAQAATAAATSQAGEAPATTSITPEVQALIDEAARKASQDANREAAALRKRTKELEEAEQARKDAELSETERLQKERDDAVANATKATSDAQAALLRAEVAVLSTSMNIVDPDAALALMDQSTVDWTEAGKPTGVKEALEALIGEKAYLVAKPGTPTLQATNSQRSDGEKTVSDAERLATLRGGLGGGQIWS